MSIEIGLIVGGLLGTFTMCIIKILHQVQNSKCTYISCCGSSCVRDVNVDLPETDTSDMSTSMTPRYSNKSEPRPTLVRPKLERSINFSNIRSPTFNSPKPYKGIVENLKKKYEVKD